MRIVRLATIAVLWSTVSSSTAAAQDTTTTKKPVIGSPVFLIMPGGLTTCTMSCPADESNTDFNARFQTVIPTATDWLAFVAGAQWGWADSSAHAPAAFFGAVVPIVPFNNLTNGWLSVSVDPLGVAGAPGSKGTNFVMELALTSSIGARMMGGSSFLRGLGLYFLIDQQLSNVGRDENGDKDYWNPALVWGAFFQISPWP